MEVERYEAINSLALSIRNYQDKNNVGRRSEVRQWCNSIAHIEEHCRKNRVIGSGTEDGVTRA